MNLLQSLTLGNRTCLLLYRCCAVSLRVTGDTSVCRWGLSSEKNGSSLFPTEPLSSKKVVVTGCLFGVTKPSFVLCLLLSIRCAGHTNALPFLSVQGATFSCCEPPRSNSDPSPFPLQPFYYGIQTLQDSEGRIKTTGIPVCGFLFTAGILVFPSPVQNSACALSFAPAEAGAGLLGDWGAGTLM